MPTERTGADPEWPDDRAVPVRRPDMSTVPLDDNVAIYDEVGHLLIMLNASASAVLDCCDGATSFEEIVEILSSEHSGDLAVIRNDAWQTLRKLASLGLVTNAT